jgi:hypothetical protein
MLRLIFQHPDEGVAEGLAEAWCTSHAIAIGARFGHWPRGLMHGADFFISQWDHLSSDDIVRLDGRLCPEPRTGRVVVRIAWPAPARPCAPLALIRSQGGVILESAGASAKPPTVAVGLDGCKTIATEV